MSEWKEVKLSDVAQVITGATPSKLIPSHFEGEIPFVTPGDLDSDAPIESTSTSLSRIGAASVRMLPKDAVLVSCIGTLGKVGIAGVPLATNQQINALVFDTTRILPRYGMWAAKGLKSRMEQIAPSTTLRIINKSRFSELTIQSPPLVEQQRIAAILDQADALRSKRRQTLAKVIGLEAEIYNHSFISAGVQDGKITLGLLITDGPQNGLYKHSSFYGTGTPILRIDGFYDGEIVDITQLKRVQASESEIKLYSLRPGDIVINRVNSREYLGKSAIVENLPEPTVFESNMMRFTVDSQRILPEFLIATLQSQGIRAQIMQSAKDAVNQSSINQTDVRKLELTLPPMGAQKKFAASTAKCRALRRTLMKDEFAMNSLFASLQYRAFNGEL